MLILGPDEDGKNVKTLLASELDSGGIVGVIDDQQTH